jgi:hypothetical protein
MCVCVWGGRGVVMCGCFNNCVGVFVIWILVINTEYTQKNSAISKVNKKFISYLSRAQPTPLPAATVQVSQALQQFTSHAYGGAAGPVSKMASQQEKAFCVLRFEVSRTVITAQREFCARFRTAGSAYETWTVAAADGLCCVRERWEINFLLTFETVPFLCVYPV